MTVSIRPQVTQQPAPTQDELRSLRTTIDYLRRTGELLETDVEIDPRLEFAALQKHLDGSLPMLFANVKGYPGKRLFTNLFAMASRTARLFGVEETCKFKFKAVEALRRPLPPRVVESAPVQEIVYTGDDIDAHKIIPMIQHTARDPGPTLGGGNTVAGGTYFWGGFHIGYNRMNFREPNSSSFQISPGSHMDMVATEWYHKDRIPLTINMGVPPACTVMAGAGFDYMILPKGSDELAVAGGLQGFPVDLVKCKTVDAYALADAEMVIEGYLDTTAKVWESELAELEGKQGVHPFHPEWAGYMGKAYRTYKFVATAITTRRDNPIYYPLIVHGMDDHFIDCSMREASFLELADRIVPDFVVDTNIPMGMTDWGGCIFQVRKRRKRDDGYQKNILAAALACSIGMRMAIAVDADINIYNMEDVMWAISTRVDPSQDIQIVAPGGMGQTFQPAERAAAAPGAQWVRAESRYPGGIAIDATVPFEFQWAFERANYPVDLVDPSHWFTPEQLAHAKDAQLEYPYARLMADMGI
jgi:UbiD family decarboxylase